MMCSVLRWVHRPALRAVNHDARRWACDEAAPRVANLRDLRAVLKLSGPDLLDFLQVVCV